MVELKAICYRYRHCFGEHRCILYMRWFKSWENRSGISQEWTETNRHFISYDQMFLCLISLCFKGKFFNEITIARVVNQLWADSAKVELDSEANTGWSRTRVPQSAYRRRILARGTITWEWEKIRWLSIGG